jgi:competence protein ComEC
VPWDGLARAAHWVFALLMVPLDALAAAPGAVWQQHAPAPWTVVLASCGVAWLLLPRGAPARFAGLLLLLPMFAVGPPGPAPGALWLTFLDVGQGLAVVARTADHVLLYDTGPLFSAEADAGNRVVLPFLRGEGITRLDRVIVTHDDADHSGGARSVMRTLPAALLQSSLDTLHPLQALAAYRTPCIAGQHWMWNDVRFEVLHPLAESYARPFVKANWRSCVVRIATAAGTVLLTGDIEEPDERDMLARGTLPADVLLVPHHGSRTSSSPAFLAAVQPRLAIVTAGYRNRFGHPRPEVLDRYRAAGAEVLRTDRDGAVTLRFEAGTVAVSRHRDEHRRYWRWRG